MPKYRLQSANKKWGYATGYTVTAKSSQQAKKILRDRYGWRKDKKLIAKKKSY